VNDPAGSVNGWTEPQLFPHGGLAITAEALVDTDDATVLFVCSARDVVQGKLLHLWSSSPRPFEDYERALRDGLREFSEQVRNHTGPF
jgi:hypothetical protein